MIKQNERFASITLELDSLDDYLLTETCARYSGFIKAIKAKRSRAYGKKYKTKKDKLKNV